MVKRCPFYDMYTYTDIPCRKGVTYISIDGDIPFFIICVLDVCVGKVPVKYASFSRSVTLHFCFICCSRLNKPT